jgi:hypothetical protein
MEETTIKNYLSSDFAKAVKFYDDRSKSSKRWYRFLSIYVIVVAAGLTALVSFAPSDQPWRILSAAVSATIVIATGLLSHFKCHENWLSYRNSWDALQRERRFYETSAGEYKKAGDKETLFVERIEAILARESAEFYSRHAKGDEKTITNAIAK